MFWVSLKCNDMCPYKRKVEGDLSQTEEKTQTHRGDMYMKREAEIGEMCLQTKELQEWPQPPKIRREVWNRFSPGVSVGTVQEDKLAPANESEEVTFMLRPDC